MSFPIGCYSPSLQKFWISFLWLLRERERERERERNFLYWTNNTFVNPKQFFFFFFFENEVKTFIYQWIQSWITSCCTSLGMSFDQTWGQGIVLAALANLSATAFPCLFTCIKEADTKFKTKAFTSSRIWP